MKKMLRHGDVVLIPIDAIPAEATKKKGLVLAEGEKTGHAHRVDVGELFETKNGKLYLKVDKLSKISHEEHKKSPIPQGVYIVIQKRQYNPDGSWEPVQD